MYLFKVKLGGREKLCETVAGSVSIGFLPAFLSVALGVLLEVSFLEFSGDTGSVCSFSTAAKLRQARNKLLLMLSGASSLSNFKDSKGGD